MKHTKKVPPRSARGPAKFPGIVGAAHALGVNRTHLYLVLSGKRTSARLLKRYHALNKAAA
ncbi:MAG: hypothetical protein WC205_16840 [Opitutaceae bacterium]|jgi:hypothetical protein